MATHKLTMPVRVGDLANGITVDKLDLVSVSINFQPTLDMVHGGPAHLKSWRNRVIVSCMLHHAASGWTHTVTLSENTQKDAEARAMWEKIKAKFPDFEKEILAMIAEYLPPGTIS